MSVRAGLGLPPPPPNDLMVVDAAAEGTAVADACTARVRELREEGGVIPPIVWVGGEGRVQMDRVIDGRIDPAGDGWIPWRFA